MDPGILFQKCANDLMHGVRDEATGSEAPRNRPGLQKGAVPPAGADLEARVLPKPDAARGWKAHDPKILKSGPPLWVNIQNAHICPTSEFNMVLPSWQLLLPEASL